MTSAPHRPSPQLVFETLSAFQRSAALEAAIELDLFHLIGDDSLTAAAIAAKLNAPERGVRILCDFLTLLGFLTKSENRYAQTPTSLTFLDPRSPSCVAGTAKFTNGPVVSQPFFELAEIVRKGRTTLPGDGTVDPDNPVWIEFAHSMAPMMGPMAAPLAAIVLHGATRPMQVLDVAAGHGLFGIEVAKANPNAVITALDWANVLNVASANAVRANVQERYRLLPGSAFDVDFGGPYDIVLLTNFLHHFDEPTCVSLLKKVHAALNPGGKVASLEFVPNEDRVSPPACAAFALVMLATTPSGDAYTLSEYERMHLAAGFSRVTGQPVPGGPHTVVIGE
ncbi:MAG: class I SAM-dependent methyltransferase [Bryobacteraceae bacterium]|nr:class I SAM-dependent methyltransferase [Bryobacteraceae bacterium]